MNRKIVNVRLIAWTLLFVAGVLVAWAESTTPVRAADDKCDWHTYSRCNYWTDRVGSNCLASMPDVCKYWKDGEEKCLTTAQVSEDCKEDIERQHRLSMNMKMGASRDFPDLEWIAFYRKLDGITLRTSFSTEFIPMRNGALKVRLGDQDISKIVLDTAHTIIKPEYKIPVNYHSDDYSHDELEVTLKFSYLPREPFDPPLPNDLLVISYDVRVFNKGKPRMETFTAPDQQHTFPRILIVQEDKAAFEQDLRNILMDVVFDATKGLICVKHPDEKFCAAFYPAFPRVQ